MRIISSGRPFCFRMSSPLDVVPEILCVRSSPGRRPFCSSLAMGRGGCGCASTCWAGREPACLIMGGWPDAPIMRTAAAAATAAISSKRFIPRAICCNDVRRNLTGPGIRAILKLGLLALETGSRVYSSIVIECGRGQQRHWSGACRPDATDVIRAGLASVDGRSAQPDERGPFSCCFVAHRQSEL